MAKNVLLMIITKVFAGGSRDLGVCRRSPSNRVIIWSKPLSVSLELSITSVECLFLYWPSWYCNIQIWIEVLIIKEGVARTIIVIINCRLIEVVPVNDQVFVIVSSSMSSYPRFNNLYCSLQLTRRFIQLHLPRDLHMLT